MPEDDVSDLRDVVDAINKLCETMKTSYDEYEDCEEEITEPTEVVHAHRTEPSTPQNVHIYTMDSLSDTITEHVPVPEPATYDAFAKDRCSDSDLESIVETSELSEQEMHITDGWSSTTNELDMPTFQPVHQKLETCVTESWNDRIINPLVFTSESVAATTVVVPQPRTTNVDAVTDAVTERRDRVVEDIELVTSDAEQVPCEPMSEMYYTASSEVSLLSDIDMREKTQGEDSDKERDDRNSVIAGHVAAMRERFESMTRTNTPCPDLIRSTSPSFEVFRNTSTSPDHLG